MRLDNNLGGDSSSAKLGERQQDSERRKRLSQFIAAGIPCTITWRDGGALVVRRGMLAEFVSRNVVAFDDGQLVKVQDMERVG